MSRGWRTSSLALLVLTSACASSKPVERPAGPTGPQDYFVETGAVADLQRGEVKQHGAEQLGELGNEAGERWITCGAKSAIHSRYQSATDPSLSLDATLVEFADTQAAFCGFTPGRSESSNPVPELEGAFEEGGLLRALRGTYVVEVRSKYPDLLRDRSRAVLRGIVASMPQGGSFELPGRAFLPENTLVPGSERIVPVGALPTVDAPAVVADVRCGDKAQAHAVVFTFSDAGASRAALEKYQGVSLENFMEVAPFERSGAKGIRVRGEQGEAVLFHSGPHLVGITDAVALEPCDEAVTEVALRAAPLAASPQDGDGASTAEPSGEGHTDDGAGGTSGDDTSGAAADSES